MKLGFYGFGLLCVLIAVIGVVSYDIFEASTNYKSSKVEYFNILSTVRKAGCFKCHDITKRKTAPSLHVISKRYEDNLLGLKSWLLSGDIVVIDGIMDTHSIVNQKDVHIISVWILSLKNYKEDI